MKRLLLITLLLSQHALAQTTATPGGNTYVPVPTTQGLAIPNSNNGGTETVKPQLTTGLYVNSGSWYFDTASSIFTGNIYADPVLATGYNVSASIGVNQTAPDPFGIGIWSEGDYQVGNTSTPATTGSTATGGSTTTLTDTIQTWNTNSWANWVLYNLTTGGRCLIASNTPTQLTCTSAMVLSDGVTAAPANASTNSYNIYDRLLESYLQTTQITTNNAAFRRMRPLYFTFDKATAAAQGVLAPGGGLTITNATATNPPVFTTSVAHGMQAGSRNYVKFGGNGTTGQSNLAGGTWGTNLNGKQFLVTVISSTTFSVGVNATGYGTYTASSGTCTVEGGVNSSSMMFDPIYNGMIFALPSWNSTPSDSVAVLWDSLFVLNGRQGSNGNFAQMRLAPDVGGSSSVQGLFPGGGFQYDMRNGDASQAWDLYTASGVGVGQIISLSVYRPNATDMRLNIGNQGWGPSFVNMNAQGETASNPMISMRGANSQTGDYLDIWDSATGNTTKIVKIDSAGNFSGPSNISTGTTFTLGTGTGACATTGTLTGGPSVGSFACTGTAGASTIIINLPTAPHGWSCNASDVTSGVVWAQASPVATNSCKISGTLTTTNDVVVFDALGY